MKGQIVSNKELIDAGKEFNKIMDPDPPINVAHLEQPQFKKSMSKTDRLEYNEVEREVLIKKLRLYAKQLLPEDEISEETIKTMRLLGIPLPGEKIPEPTKEKEGKKTVAKKKYDEEEELFDDETEDEDSDDDDDDDWEEEEGEDDDDNDWEEEEGEDDDDNEIEEEEDSSDDADEDWEEEEDSDSEEDIDEDSEEDIDEDSEDDVDEDGNEDDEDGNEDDDDWEEDEMEEEEPVKSKKGENKVAKKKQEVEEVVPEKKRGRGRPPKNETVKEAKPKDKKVEVTKKRVREEEEEETPAPKKRKVVAPPDVAPPKKEKTKKFSDRNENEDEPQYVTITTNIVGSKIGSMEDFIDNLFLQGCTKKEAAEKLFKSKKWSKKLDNLTERRAKQYIAGRLRHYSQTDDICVRSFDDGKIVIYRIITADMIKNIKKRS